MIEKNTVEGLVLKHIEGSGIFLVDVHIGSGNTILVHVDSFEGVSIDTCVEISRFLNGKLDRDAEDFSLEVSSPGLGSPFRVKQQYEKNVGRTIEVLMNDGTKVKGELLSVGEEGIEMVAEEKKALEGNPKKKKTVKKERKVSFNDIKTTKAIISFK